MKISRHDALLLLVVLIWGANFGFVKVSLKEIDPVAFSAARLLLGAPAMLLVLRFFDKSLLLEGNRIVKTRADLTRFAALSLFLAGDYVLFIKGVALTTSANASILYSASPILIAALGIIRGKRLNRLTGLGLVTAFSGVVMVIAASEGAGITGFWNSATIQGDIIIGMAVICWALFTHFSTTVLDRYSAIRVTAYAMTGAAVIAGLSSYGALLSQAWNTVSFMGWAGLVYSTVLSTVVSLAIWYYAVSKIGPLKVVAFQYLIPVTAIILAFVVWKEALYPFQVVGGVLVLAGVRFVRLS